MKIILFVLMICCISCSDAPSYASEVNILKRQVNDLENKLATSQIDETAFIHTVFFWINDGVSDQDKSNFAKEGLGDLLTCKSVYKGYYGPPAKTPRDVVDNSYDFALVCHFTSAEDQEVYQNDPQHLAFIEKYKDLWKRVQVYDNLVNK